MYVLFEINTNFLLSWQHFIELRQETLHPYLISQIKDLFFTACLLVLIVSDVYNISNEYQLPDQSAKY